MRLPVYLDNQSTTAVDPRVFELMKPWFTEDFGNAASRSHPYGWKAEAAVEKARAQVAQLIGASDKEIVFTSGATESDNLAIKGVAEAYRDKGNHLVTAVTEHKAVLDPCKHLVNQGAAEATWLPVQSDGRVSLDALGAAITERTVLVSVMLANNEIGVVQPVEAIGKLCRARGVLFHTDAVQGVGKIPFDVESAQVDLASLSAHKLYGPKGVGALYVRKKPRVKLLALIDGGGHERGMRSGTLNVPGIVGFGAACELARLEREAESARILELRERLRKQLQDALPGVHVNGSLEHRLPGNLNASFQGVDSDALMAATRDVAVSSGSACMSATLEPSYVLRALGVSPALAAGSIRFGIGRFNTAEEIDFSAQKIIDQVRRLRAMTA